MDSCAGWIEVTIYPVYAFGLVVAASLTSQGPPPWVLVLQAGIQGPVGPPEKARGLARFAWHDRGVVATSLGAGHH